MQASAESGSNAREREGGSRAGERKVEPGESRPQESRAQTQPVAEGELTPEALVQV